MSLRDYKNFSDIITNNTPSSGQRFSKTEIDLLSPVKFKANLQLSENNGLNLLSKQKFEFHLYGLDGEYIAGNQASTYVKKIDDDYLFLDVKEDVNKLEYRGGVFRFVYNFLYDIVGSYNTDKLFISEISPSRRELKLKLQSPDREESITELENLFRLFLDEKTFYLNLVLNFGQNKIIPIANIASDGSATTLFIKLFDPLPEDIQNQTLVWVAREILPPYIDSVQIDYSFENININTIRGPKTDLDELNWNRIESTYKSWTNLLSSTNNVSNKIENFINSVRFGTELNLDFTQFKNFVYYGSAKERVDNFFFKIKLLEYYNSLVEKLELNAINNTSEILSYSNSINSIIRSFDAFERYLYYGDSDNFVKTTKQFNEGIINPYPKYLRNAVDFRWIDWAQLWVGANVIWERPGTLGNVRVLNESDSPEVAEWYSALSSFANEYDELNNSQLLKTIPEHILIDPANEPYILFVNMIGHYYDNIWIYIENFNKKNTQEHNPSIGKPSDLLPYIAKQYNWMLSNNNNTKELWEYFFNLTEEDQLKTYDNSLSNNTLNPSESTKHVWARIINNLPYLLKTKGSARSVKALFSTFGIPESIIRIKEYGGPGIIKDEVARTLLRKDYPFLNLEGGYSIEIPWNALNSGTTTKWISNISGSDINWNTQTVSSSINAVYANILPGKIEQNETMNILSIGSGSKIEVIAKQLSEISGSFILAISGSSGILSASIQADSLFDNTPTVLVLQTDQYYTSSNSNITYTLYASQERYNKIVLFESCSISITGSLTQSYNSAWFTESIFKFGSFESDFTQNHFTGSINEIRFWKTPLSEKIIKSHTLSYRNYNHTNVTGSYDNLLVRIPFWVSSSVFNGAYTSIATNKEFSKNFGIPYIPTASYTVLDYYIAPETATIGLEAINPTKERIESSQLLSSLEVDRRREISSYDLYTNDSNKLKIGFSPQFNIDDDIQDQLGSFELDSYIDFDDNDRKYYRNLSELSKFYAKTQNDENPIIKYLRILQAYDFTVFDQIKQLIPARSNLILGLIIENSLLQRVRIKFTPDVTVATDKKQTIQLDVNSSTNTLKVDRINTSISSSGDFSITQLDEYQVNVQQNAANTIGNISINNTAIDLTSDRYISISGTYSKQTVVLPAINGVAKTLSRYLIVPVSKIDFVSNITQSLNSNFNYELPIDIETTEFVNTNILDLKNLQFYKKIQYYYQTRNDYENNMFYSYSLESTDDGTYVYAKSKGLQNSTYIGTKNSALKINQISTQPGLSNYSPVFEITGSQLEPVFTYEFIESSGSGITYEDTNFAPIIPTQNS